MSLSVPLHFLTYIALEFFFFFLTETEIRKICCVKVKEKSCHKEAKRATTKNLKHFSADKRWNEAEMPQRQ